MISSDTWKLLADSFWKILLPGLKMTIPLTILSFTLALVISILVALIQFANVPVLKQSANTMATGEPKVKFSYYRSAAIVK